MSAAPVFPSIAPAGSARRAQLRPVPTSSSPTPAGERNPARPDGGLHHLAPTSRAQAWRRRAGVAAALASVLVLLVVALSTLLGSPVTDGPRFVPVAEASVVVEPGQTLWDVARLHAPAGTATTDYVAELRTVNSLQGTTLDAWQVLRLPAA